MSDSLTPEQSAILFDLQEQWVKVGLCTDAADRPRAEAGVRQSYEAIGRTAPELMVWFGSPLSGAIACHFLSVLIDDEKQKDPDYIKAEAQRRTMDLVNRFLVPEPDHKTLTEVKDALNKAPREAVWGAQDCAWLCYYDGLRTLGYVEADKVAKFEGLMEVAKSALWWWPFEEAVVLTERPAEINLDEQGRLHNDKGFAVGYRDGWGYYSWHGYPVPAWVVRNPTPEKILAESNTETRRCAIESLGWPQFIEDAKLTLVSGPMDDPGNPGKTLSLYDTPMSDWDIRVLLCTNGTKERDGTVRSFGLTTPAEIDDAIAAAAWTYDVPVEEYRQLQRRT